MLVADIQPGTPSSKPEQLVSLGNNLVAFVAYPGTGQARVYRSSGTSPQTYALRHDHRRRGVPERGEPHRRRHSRGRRNLRRRRHSLDAGSASDGGATVDAGQTGNNDAGSTGGNDAGAVPSTPDAGTSITPDDTTDSSGCGCSSTSSAAPAFGLLALMLTMLRARRRN